MRELVASDRSPTLAGRGMSPPAGLAEMEAIDATESEVPSRPARPRLVELASALLLVGGAFSILTSIEVIARLPGNGTMADWLASLNVGLGLGLVVLGVLVRAGRAWVLSVNVVAVMAFIEVSSGSAFGLVFGTLDLFVVAALFRERAWFQWPGDTSP
jgi:hypothetical protein